MAMLVITRGYIQIYSVLDVLQFITPTVLGIVFKHGGFKEGAQASSQAAKGHINHLLPGHLLVPRKHHQLP